MGRAKQTIGCLIVLCLFLSSLIVTQKFSVKGNPMNNPDGGDELDQEQIVATSSGSVIDPEDCIAQSFKPTFNILTRVEVRLEKFNNITSDVILIIRDTLTGKNLTSINVSSSAIYDSPSWIEFNFRDIEVTPEKTYYIICKTYGGDWARKILYKWSCTNLDPYSRGQAHCSVDGGKSWQPDKMYATKDQCFRTYGIIKEENQPPKKPQRPIGPNSGKIGETYTYKTSSLDANGDQIYYLFDWGDGNKSEWLGPYNSADIVEASYLWNYKGAFSITVKAKDKYNAESEWSDPLVISMPKSYQNALTVFREENMYYLQIAGREIMPLPFSLLSSS